MLAAEIAEWGIENFSEYDNGIPAKLFKRCLQEAVLDCIDRPADNKARTVTFKVVLKPVLPESREGEPKIFECESILAQIDCKSSIPVRRTKKYNLNFTNKGQLTFSRQTQEVQ